MSVDLLTPRGPGRSVVEDDRVPGVGGHHLEVGGAGSPQATRVAARLIVVVSRREIVQVVGERLVRRTKYGGQGGAWWGEPARFAVSERGGFR